MACSLNQDVPCSIFVNMEYCKQVNTFFFSVKKPCHYDDIIVYLLNYLENKAHM